MNERESKNLEKVKSYLLALALGLMILAIVFFLMFYILIPLTLPSYLGVLYFFLFLGPFFILLIYVIYRALVPVTGSMPLKSFRRWIWFYPLLVGYGALWALLSYIFNTFTPSLPQEYRDTTIPILVIMAITLILSLTRLRYPIARFLNKVFGTESQTR